MRLTPLLLLLSLFLLPALGQAAEKTVYGLNEYARLADIDLEVAAKLDTGAKTASLSARDIKRFKRNGESWVRFSPGDQITHFEGWKLTVREVDDV
ncbi:MAG: RimK/LysX family protein, partial [Pseudomonas sp.]